VAAATSVEETAGPANTFLSQVGQQGGAIGHLLRRVLRRRSRDGEVHLEEAAGPGHGSATQATPAQRPGDAEVVVIASGNLAMVYFTRHPGRMTREQMDAAYPGLVDSLVAHPGVGYLVLASQTRGTVVLGRGGARYLDEDAVEGTDPLGEFGEAAADKVRRHAALAHVGDLILNSPLDLGTGEVGAYEELVGNHGGLGGWQTQAVLVHPSAWPLDEPRLVGADAVHRQLVTWLHRIGQRRDLPPPDGDRQREAAGPEAERTTHPL
jgi:hypothetical protein